ncbi:MAG: response regulator transcription factor [Erysipelotrichaceae bacterium]|nr:response regulator transcription factor [Erysipelotrichaceae bacterium]MDP3305623.1 response regulator transcription factor [Erysipelotrichaceae bacterium]
MTHRILVVEDQPEISSIVLRYLQSENYAADLAQDGFSALKLFSQHTFHLVILDVMMPGINGFEVLRDIRNISDVPVIMLTAKGEEDDRITGFDTGADDYIVKPFSPKELIRRVKAILRRVYGDSDEIVLSIPPLKLYETRMKVEKDGTDIELTASEFKILYTLMKHKDQILTREQIIRNAFNEDYEGYDRNIDSLIKRLRQKIEDDPKNPTIILTKYGAGYMLGGESQ